MLEIGETATITFSALGEANITFESSNPDIVMVSDLGIVTAIKEGTATIFVKAEETENYFGIETEVEVTVEKKLELIEEAQLLLEVEKVIYTGESHTPKITMLLQNSVLVENKDYIVSYDRNIDAGIASIIVNGIGNYTGRWTKDFIIEKAKQNLSLKVSKTELEVDETGIIDVTSKTKVTFQSLNENIATVNEYGVIVAKESGVAVIKVMAEEDNNYQGAEDIVIIIVLKEELPEEPEDTKEPEIPKEPEDTKEPEIPKEPEDTKEPEIPEETEDTKEPEIPKEPEDTKEPEFPEELEDTKEPEKSEESVKPEISVPSDISKDPQSLIKPDTSITSKEPVVLDKVSNSKEEKTTTSEKEQLKEDSTSWENEDYDEETYTVTFQVNGGEELHETFWEMDYGEFMGELPAAERKGYLFRGWYLKSGTKVTEQMKIYDDLTVYARWKKVTKPLKVTNVTLKSSKKRRLIVSYSKVKDIAGYQILYSTTKSFTKKTTITTSSKKLTKNFKYLTSKKKYYVKVRAYRIDSTGARVYGRYSTLKSQIIK